MQAEGVILGALHSFFPYANLQLMLYCGWILLHSPRYLMSKINEQVMQALGTVIEPELNRDIVSLNMVRDSECEWRHCRIHHCLDHPGLPPQRCLR